MSNVFHAGLFVRLALALAVAVGGIAWVSTPANAQISATVSPSLLELQANAGASGEQQITMTVTGSDEVAVTAEVVPYDSTADVPSAVEWLELDETQVDASPDKGATFTLAIEIPDDAADGGHYAAVTLTTGGRSSTDPAAESGTGEASIQGRFVIPILIRVGDEDAYERTATLNRIAPVLEQDGRIGIWGEISNTGNVDFRAPGNAMVTDADGEPVAEMEFPETTPILPGETEVIRATGTLPLPEGTEYALEGSIDFGGEDQAEASATFTVGPVAPTGQLAVCENLDRGPTIDLRIENPGGIGLSAGVSLTISDVNDNQVAATTLSDTVLIWPGEEQSLSTDAPTRLETGVYSLVVQVQAGAGDPTTIELPFEIGGASDLTAPLCSPAN